MKKTVYMIHQIASPYRVVEKFGGAFIGLVYKADDTGRYRFVALKFPPREFLKEPQPLAQREPLATSALNQPNIKCARGGGAWV